MNEGATHHNVKKDSNSNHNNVKVLTNKYGGMVGMPVNSDVSNSVFRSMLDEILQDFKESMKQDIQNMHLEILRQFQIQKVI